jgi:hypothetical protein
MANVHIENARIKMLEMEKLGIEKSDPSEMTYIIKKKEKEMRDKEE